MRVLITNDDGADAYGLSILLGIARTLTQDVWVVAPADELAEATSSLQQPGFHDFERRAERVFAVRGNSVECARRAFGELLRDRAPDLLLTGVNAGEKVGEGVVLSNAIAAILFGHLSGIPSIALNQALRPDQHDTQMRWEVAGVFGPAVVRALMQSAAARAAAININFPACSASDVRAIKVTTLAREHPSLEPTSDFSVERANYRSLDNGYDLDTDVDALAANCVSITPLHAALTHNGLLAALQRDLGVMRSRNVRRADSAGIEPDGAQFS
jgi:5'-nucleotidase